MEQYANKTSRVHEFSTEGSDNYGVRACYFKATYCIQRNPIVVR